MSNPSTVITSNRSLGFSKMAVWGTTIGPTLSASPTLHGGGGARLQSRCKCEVDPQEKHLRGVDNLGVDCFEETTFTSSNGSGLLTCSWKSSFSSFSSLQSVSNRLSF